MGEWLSQAPALLVAVLALFGPGLPTAWLIGLRGPLLIGISGALSLAMIAVASIVAPLVGLAWSPLPVVIIAAATTAVVAAVVARLGRDSRPHQIGRGGAGVWVSLAITAVLWGGLVAFGTGAPSHPAQHFDVIFHLNAIAFVADHGSASPFDMTMATPALAHAFYPTLWHALVALVVPAAGGIVAATNVTTLVVTAVLWPAAVLFLTACVWPDRLRTQVAAPAVSFGFAIFPLGFLNWGALYPNLLGNALIPVVLGLGVLSTRGSGRPRWQQSLVVVTLVAAAGAAAIAHPSSLLAALALGIPLAVGRIIALWRDGEASHAVRIGATTAVGLGILALLAVWPTLNVTTNEWLPYESLAQALGESVALGPVGRPAALLIAALSIVGSVAAVRQGHGRWLVASQVLAIGLFLVAAWLPALALRSAIVGVWYDDVVRVGAILAIAALPLAARGADAVASHVARWWRDDRRPVAIVRVAAIAAVLLTCGMANLLVPRFEVGLMRDVSFLFTEESQGLSPNEVELFARAAEILPDDAVVVGDPLTGAGLLYAYTGHRVVFPHIKGRYGQDAALLGAGLQGGGDVVCAAADRLGVRYAIDFGDRVIFPGYQELYAGLHDLSASPILTPVANVGTATLYEITGCE